MLTMMKQPTPEEVEAMEEAERQREEWWIFAGGVTAVGLWGWVLYILLGGLKLW